MATAKELYSFLDKTIPKSLSCSWDNDGAMCISDPDRVVNRVLVALDVTSGAVEYAVENGFDAIISHHPLIFSPMRSINGCDVKSRVITKLMRNGISAFSFHTRLDAVDGGVNDCLCKLLGFENTEPFMEDGLPLARMATVDEISGRNLAAHVKNTLGTPCVTYSNGNKLIRKVVVIGGGGKDLIDSAMDAFADAMITGEVSYNAALDAADSGFCIISAGHFYTENPVLLALENKVKEYNPSIYVEAYNSNLMNEI